jgi:hypothetical protein
MVATSLCGDTRDTQDNGYWGRWRDEDLPTTGASNSNPSWIAWSPTTTKRGPRAVGRRTPNEAFEARTKASPRLSCIHVDGYRIRHDQADKTGNITVRNRSKLHHIGLERALSRKRIVLLTAGRNVRVIHRDGQLIRELTIDPKWNYQAQR